MTLRRDKRGFTQSFVTRFNRRLRRTGFTLVEMLVALAIFSIIGLSVASVFRSGLRTWRAGNQWSEENQTARNFFRTASKELENSVKGEPNILFEGGKQQISFLTLLDKHHAGLGNLQELARVVYRYDEKEQTLKKIIAGKEEGFDTEKAKEILIADGIDSMEFAYAFKPVYENEAYRWKNEWKDPKEIPRGVRIRMGNFHTIVFVPLGALGDDSALQS